ncbi:MAG: hypothetical protein LBV28_02005 [Puniceicoccales bacterium]|jgi:hypothetical protein|nr:hypothetical protein [Puniceicoccales bacterium]
MHHALLRHPFTAALLLLLAVVPAQASQSLPVNLPEKAPVEVTLESFLDEVPSTTGFVPVLVTLRNHTDFPQTFLLNYSSSVAYGNGGGFDGTAALSVDAQGRSQTYVYIPLIGHEDFRHVSLKLSGSGIPVTGHTLSTSYISGIPVGMGDRTAAEHWSALEAEMQILAKASPTRGWSSGSSSGYVKTLTGTKITPAAAPADWRAYTTFSSLYFDTAEWHGLEPAARAAIAEWVGFGGKLYLLFSNDAQRDSLHIAGAVERKTDGTDTTFALGLGEITRLRYTNTAAGKKAFIEKTATRVFAGTHYSQRLKQSDIKSSKWGLARRVSEIPRATSLLFVFMIVFALAIGPLNFLLLAPSRRRYRILWTTPLIAIAASGVLGLIILIGDGTGGQGRRLILAVLLPEQKRILIEQEQLSRTGLLLGSNFDFDSTAEIQPFPETDKHGNSTRENNHYAKSETGWNGDWFSSRGRQAQFIRSVRAARGSVRVTFPAQGREGSIFSTLETPLAELFLLSPDGTALYKATHLAPGVKRPLAPATKDETNRWWSPQKSLASGILAADFDTLVKRNGFFYARAEDSAALVQPTLKSVKWEDDVAIIVGPFEVEK